VVVASCSEGTDIKLFHAADGKSVGAVDTSQLQNHMAALSPDGRFLAAAAFTADVKVWELVYSRDGAVKEVPKVMQLKGHKGAVYWLSFTDDSKRIVTSSKDGTIKVWNIDVRYHLDEDPKCLHTFPCGLPPIGKTPPHYDRIAVAPGAAILAAAAGSTLHWVDLKTGEVLEKAENAHEGEITCLAWAPQARGPLILATGSTDRKVKLWKHPVVEGTSK
jgi:WD40 repeat protein